MVALIGAPAAAQRADAPLGEILKAIEETPAPKPAEKQPAPPPALPPSGIGSIDLPASEVEEATAAETHDADADAAVKPAEPDGEAYWQAMLEQRRSQVNAEESPLVQRLNEAVSSRISAEREEAERADAEHRRAIAEHEAAVRRSEEEHKAEMERYRREVIRQEAEYQARVRDCLKGVRGACARPGE